jgi:hypothetical protein
MEDAGLCFVEFFILQRTVRKVTCVVKIKKKQSFEYLRGGTRIRGTDIKYIMKVILAKLFV